MLRTTHWPRICVGGDLLWPDRLLLRRLRVLRRQDRHLLFRDPLLLRRDPLLFCRDGLVLSQRGTLGDTAGRVSRHGRGAGIAEGQSPIAEGRGELEIANRQWPIGHGGGGIRRSGGERKWDSWNSACRGGQTRLNPNSESKSPEQTEETEREALARTHAGTSVSASLCAGPKLRE